MATQGKRKELESPMKPTIKPKKITKEQMELMEQETLTEDKNQNQTTSPKSASYATITSTPTARQTLSVHRQIKQNDDRKLTILGNVIRKPNSSTTTLHKTTNESTRETSVKTAQTTSQAENPRVNEAKLTNVEDGTANKKENSDKQQNSSMSVTNTHPQKLATTRNIIVWSNDVDLANIAVIDPINLYEHLVDAAREPEEVTPLHNLKAIQITYANTEQATKMLNCHSINKLQIKCEDEKNVNETEAQMMVETSGNEPYLKCVIKKRSSGHRRK